MIFQWLGKCVIWWDLDTGIGGLMDILYVCYMYVCGMCGIYIFVIYMFVICVGYIYIFIVSGWVSDWVYDMCVIFDMRDEEKW